MSDLQKKFESAAAAAQKLARRPDNASLLNLYAYYKQATVGDAGGRRPGFTDPVGQAKFDAWVRVKGLSKDEAMQAYIRLVEKLAH